MPIFNNAVIAASFKASANPNPKDTNNLGNNKKNQNGIGICEDVKGFCLRLNLVDLPYSHIYQG
jgi:hypothetical protein